MSVKGAAGEEWGKGQNPLAVVVHTDLSVLAGSGSGLAKPHGS